MKRREFFKKSTVAGAALGTVELADLLTPGKASAMATGGGIDIEEAVDMLEQGKRRNIMPRIRRELVENPKAVFLIDTDVTGTPDKDGFFTGSRDQFETAGEQVADALFSKGDIKGGSTFIKTNYTWIPPNCYNPACGVITSPDFTAGFINKLREMGNRNIMVGDRGGTNIRNHRQVGIYDVMDKHNIDMIMPTYKKFQDYNKRELNWHKVPNPVVWNKIPTFRPLGDKDCMFIDMPKLKAHYLTGTTLSLKNLQGAVPTGYGHYCNEWAELDFRIKETYQINKRHFEKDWQTKVEQLFLKHRAAGYKYWDLEGSYAKYEKGGGWDRYKKIKDDREAVREFMKEHPYLLRDELWTQRALDSGAAIKPTLNVVEGVVGRDGDGFGIGTDQICNIVIAGMSTFEVDVVGSWIMGHDPRELWFTRAAKERGLVECDPEKIDIYRIVNGEAVPVRSLNEIKRFRLGCNVHSMQKEINKRIIW